MHGRFLYGCFLLALTLVNVVPLVYVEPLQAEEQRPTQVIEQLNGVLLQAMKNAGSLGYKGRYGRLRPVIEDTHDLLFLAKFSIGGYWKQLDAERQSQWVGKFSDYSIATYAARFDGYSGEAFEVISEQPLKRNKMLVKSVLILPDEDDIHFDYILSQGDSGRWRIINVLVDGVSDLALKRAEYANILGKGGFDALMNALSEKIAEYSKE